MEKNPRGVVLGRYILGQRLATGGMGEVYVALQTGLGRFEKPLALKLLLPHLSEDSRAVEMFLEEAHLAARMSHPNVVHIYDLGVEEGRYFIAMELVRGAPLSTLISALRTKKHLLPAPLVAYVARALCEGLHHAHEQRGPDGKPLELVHRDVTPQNVLVSVDGEVKLTDFGIAKARDSNSHTRPGSVKGKFEYLAPEQAWGKGVDRRADVFGAAITLFHLATLESPFRRDNDAATLRAIENVPLPKLAELRPDLSPEFVQAIERAGRKNPEERFSSARAFRDVLPPADPAAADALGALVREFCKEAVDRLEEKTAHTLTLGQLTEGLTAQGKTEPDRRAVKLSLRALTWSLLAGALFAVAAYLFFAVPGTRDDARPVPVAQEPLPAPSPAPTPNPQPPETVENPAVAPEPPRPPVPDRPRPAKDEAVAAKRIGYLTVDATPWAQVFINGMRAGETPLARYPVSAGQVTVRLTNPESGLSVVKKLRIEPGKEKKVQETLR